MREEDGRADFEFLYGRWKIRNRRLANVFDRGGSEWIEFEATAEARPILDGLGNIDRFSAPALPGGRSLEGFTLRLFDPERRLWKIWWASTSRPGQLDPPVEGRFQNGAGRFVCDDEVDGHPIKVRFDWTDITPISAVWQQAFSWDDGQSWETNWIMTLTRETT
jgi:hypothetical protein